MKRLTIFIPVLLAFFVTANHSMAQDVPAKVRQAFTEKFPDAGQVKWEKENYSEYEAEFTLNGKEASANFDADGSWVETEMAMAEKELPNAVRQTLSRDYKDAELLHAYEITYPGEADTMYEVELKMNGTHENMGEEEEKNEEHERNEVNEEEEDEENVRELLFTKDGQVVNKNIMEEENEY